MKGVYEGEYSKLTDTFELDFMKAYNNSLPVSLEFEEENIVVNANDLEFFIDKYIQISVLAMNTGNFSIVESYHDSNGESYNESKDYIDYIVSKGIKEDVISIEMNGYEKVENGFLVNTKEIFIIQMVQRKERDLNLPID